MNDHELAKRLATEAGDLLLGIRGNISPVPDGASPDYDEHALGKLGDQSSNEYLIAQLNEHRAGDVIFSEESIDPQARHQADRVWIVDPLDGTSSFSRGYPGFAVHVALWERTSNSPGSITAAAVCVPMFGVTLSTADSTQNLSDIAQAFVNVETVQPEFDRDSIRMVVSPSRPPTQVQQLATNLQSEFGKPVSIQRMGSVGAKAAYIIAGHADIYLNTVGFHDWDLAAPLGIANHFGLSACLPTGEPFTLNQSGTKQDGALICRPEFVQAIVKSLA